VKTTTKNDAVTLPITVTGSGQSVIFINGGGATQISWKKVIAQLGGRYETITFDLRGHGKASKARDYSFAAFLSDIEAVMKAVGSNRPIMVGWSLGADLAVRYAAEHPGVVPGLVLVDGAVPLREGLVEDPVALRRSLNSPRVKVPMLLMRPTPYGYAISPDEYADITQELDGLRQHQLLDAYQNLDCPVNMILATESSPGKTAHANRSNRLWREGADDLSAAFPKIRIQWQAGTHSLPFTKPTEIAALINQLAEGINTTPR
jgi:esterase